MNCRFTDPESDASDTETSSETLEAIGHGILDLFDQLREHSFSTSEKKIEESAKRRRLLRK